MVAAVSGPSVPAVIPKASVHPLSLKVLADSDYPADGLRSKSWEEFAVPGAPVMDFVFTVCDEAAGEICPVWPGQPVTAHWGIPDPAAVEGSPIERERAFVTAFRQMKQRISLFTALPIASLEKSSLTARVREIGRTADAAMARRPKDEHHHGHHHLSQPGLRHLAQHAGDDPQCGIEPHVIEYLKTPPAAGAAGATHRAGRAHARARCCARRARPTPSWASATRR